MSAMKVVQCKDLIYEKWGFGKIEPSPKSIINMYGDPGTGKTMCAHAIANYLGKRLLALNYAEIESKYVGEAPKNLMAAFNTAKSKIALYSLMKQIHFLANVFKMSPLDQNKR